jgi:hypothetical protein
MEYNRTYSVDVEGRSRVVPCYSVSTCLGGLRKIGISHRKEIFCAEILRPFGSTETQQKLHEHHAGYCRPSDVHDVLGVRLYSDLRLDPKEKGIWLNL